MVNISTVWNIKKNSLQRAVAVISSLKIVRFLTPPEKIFLKFAARVGPSRLNQNAATTKQRVKRRKKTLWMVGEKGRSVPEKPSANWPGCPTPAGIATSKKRRLLSVGIYSNEENPIRIESDRCSTVSFSTCKETVSIAMSGIVSGTPWKFLQNYNSFFSYFVNAGFQISACCR